MEVLVHAPHLNIDEETIRTEVAEALERFSDRLTRVDAFVRDVNGAKGGTDKRCVLEARPRGLDPLACEHASDGVLDAVVGALGKLERMLDHRFGKLDENR